VSAPPTAADIRDRAARAAFAGPLITNVLRGLISEAIVAAALEPEWRWCSADYSSWDFDRADGVRLEVKQSAVRQTWASDSAPPSKTSFDIAARKGRWEGASWIEEPGRHAQIYVFALHGVGDETADHCDPAQWEFFVVRASDLPQTQRIGTAALRLIAVPCRFPVLAEAVADCAAKMCDAGPDNRTERFGGYYRLPVHMRGGRWKTRMR